MQRALLALILFAGAVPAAFAKPEPPLEVTLDFQAAPDDEHPAIVAARVTAAAEFPNVKLAVILPKHFVPKDDKQRLSWKVELSPGAPFEQRIAIEPPEPGNYQLHARFVAKAGDKLIKIKRPLYVIVTEEFAVATPVSLIQARRLAILEQYRIDNDLPADEPLDIEALPPDVQAALAELTAAQADAAETAPKEAKQPDNSARAEE